MDMIQDWMIINKIKMGDPDAWDILVHKYYDSVYFYCVRRCYGDCDIASDLTQDIFLKLVESLPRYRFIGKFQNYLYTMAVNTCNNYLKKRHIEQIELTDNFTTDLDTSLIDEILHDVRKETVQKALDLLPEIQREVDTPLTLGNYVPWTDLYRVLGYIYALLSIITILVSSIVFSDDNSKNINQILLVTKYGRNKMIFAKLIATSIITVSLFIIFQLVNIGVFSTMYDMSGWNSDIQTNLSLGLFDFPLQYNHIQIYFLILVMQLVGIGFVESVTLLISALMHSSMSVLAVSLGVYILPLLLVQMIKTGVGNKILYLFPINNLNVQNILGILYSKDAFFFHSFFINIGFIFIFQLLIRVGMQLYCFIYIKHWKF